MKSLPIPLSGQTWEVVVVISAVLLFRNSTSEMQSMQSTKERRRAYGGGREALGGVDAFAGQNLLAIEDVKETRHASNLLLYLFFKLLLGNLEFGNWMQLSDQVVGLRSSTEWRWGFSMEDLDRLDLVRWG
ncbi:hypothetical protein L2E82_02004 [Cichorium intybus]|uniref:Uncharacterized protein n=1 Tax=Cichorium intybus TaxID=13427 RepID=A0ACB9H0J7_CICIN|nr:hypothetical protein L2E82_02004 [Cichorium intybus]